MKLGLRRKTVDIFPFLSIFLSGFLISTSALLSDIDFSKILNVPWKVDTGNITNAGGLVDNLAKGFQPLLKQFQFSYNFPDSHRYKDPVQLIKDDGFTVTEEKINSKDGFILTAWRIQCQKNCDGKKYPVLLQHGLFCSGADWLYLDKDYVLPYLLANAGYEVWIGNARGTQYSQGHKEYDTADPKSDYWKHSVHEMGADDVPATIDRMKQVTKKDKVNYVGYSMGTTMFFIYASENPRHYGANINRFVGLAPAMHISKLSTQIEPLKDVVRSQIFHSLIAEWKIPQEGPLKHKDQIKPVFDLLNSILPSTVPFLKFVLDQSVLRTLIKGDPFIKNTPAYQRALGYFPENISLRTVRHFVQFFSKRKFSRYDNGNSKANALLYSGAAPTEYSVRDAKMPSLIIGGDDDDLVVPADVISTADTMCPSGSRGPSGAKCPNVRYTNLACFNHLDFVWGPNNETKVLVYNQVLSWFDETWNKWNDKNRRDIYPDNMDSDYCRRTYLKE